jgi:hypothetical protein
MAAEIDAPTHDFPLLYASWHRAVPGPFDLGIDFGYLGHDGSVVPGMRVVTTWEHAKLLHQVLGKAIEQREANAGTIELPPGITIGGRSTAEDEHAATAKESA